MPSSRFSDHRRASAGIAGRKAHVDRVEARPQVTASVHGSKNSICGRLRGAAQRTGMRAIERSYRGQSAFPIRHQAEGGQSLQGARACVGACGSPRQRFVEPRTEQRVEQPARRGCELSSQGARQRGSRCLLRSEAIWCVDTYARLRIDGAAGQSARSQRHRTTALHNADNDRRVERKVQRDRQRGPVAQARTCIPPNDVGDNGPDVRGQRENRRLW